MRASSFLLDRCGAHNLLDLNGSDKEEDESTQYIV